MQHSTTNSPIRNPFASAAAPQHLAQEQSFFIPHASYPYPRTIPTLPPPQLSTSDTPPYTTTFASSSTTSIRKPRGSRTGPKPLTPRFQSLEQVQRLVEDQNLTVGERLLNAFTYILATGQLEPELDRRITNLLKEAVETYNQKPLESSIAEQLYLFAQLVEHSAIGQPSSDFRRLLKVVIDKAEEHTSASETVMATGTDPGFAGQVASSVSLHALMQDFGYPATATPTVVRKILEHVGITASSPNIKEADVARVLTMMIRTHTTLPDNSSTHSLASIFQSVDAEDLRKAQSWNVENFLSVVLELNNGLDWTLVLSSLDNPEFIVYDPAGLELLLNASKIAIKDLYSFPISVFFGRWSNVRGQLSFLKQAITSVPDLFTLNKTLLRKVYAPDAVPTNTNTNGRGSVANLANQPWNSLDLIETLVTLSDGELHDEIKILMDLACQIAPETILLGLVQSKVSMTVLSQEIMNNLLLVFLTQHPNASFVLPRVWHFSRNFVCSGIVHLYGKDPSQLSRILDVAQELKSLSQILEIKPYSFSIDLAALASRRDYLNLEKWLQDHIRDEGDVFVRACLDFLAEKVTTQILREQSNAMQQSVPLSGDVVATFLRILHAHSSSMSVENAEYLKDIFNNCVQVYPRLPNVNSTAEDGTPTDGGSFTTDIEDEANSYYEKIYKREISIPQIVDLLQRFKSSSVQREQDIYKCMIHNLFDEYKFFPRYPEKELAITSVLFGSLIQHQIVTSMALGIALRYVLDALRQPVGSNLFKFGIQALMQFQSRLGEWPQYCSLLLQISHLQQTHPEIVQYIRNVQKQQIIAKVDPEPVVGGGGPSQTAVPEATDSTVITKPAEAPVFTALKLDTLLDAAGKDTFDVPPESIQDKILFIINNVSSSNLETKVKEMKDILTEQFHRWFSHYIVVKRASIEPNFHSLYISFLDGLSSRSVYRHLLHETYANIRVLLNSEKTVTSSSERSLLKNLGTWLGGITLAKNNPIKHKNLSCKDLLIQGYDNNRLIVVIPFVCKILEQCNNSKVFRPPNPWLMAIMKLLSELYHFADLKLNLKFEIEVLCKNIKLDIKDIAPTNILRSRPQKSSEASQMVKDFERISIGGPLPPSTSGLPPPMPQTMPPLTNAAAPEDVGVGFPNLASFITFNPTIPIFSTQPSLKRIVHFAIDRAIREIISPVVERSVTIAGIATRELVIKDFALEPDENKMRKAAHLMVQSLAGSLASVTCREPLRISMISHLRTLLLQNGISEQTIPEQAIYIIVNDNLDLACSVIEKTAAEKAVPEIDEGLASSYINRRKHRERTGQPYYDMAVYAASRYPSTLPESLRLKPGGLTPQQLRVYEDLARVARHVPADVADRTPRPPPVPTRVEQRQEAMPMYGTMVDEPGLPISTAQALDKFSQYAAELDKHIAQNAMASLATLPTQNEVRAIIRQMVLLVTQAYNRDEAGLIFAQRVVSLLYKHDSNLAREVYVFLLEKLCELSKRAAKEVTSWLLYADDDRKYNVATYVAIIQARLLGVPELDMQLARLMEIGRMPVVEFTAKLIRKCLLEDPPSATQNDFFNSVEVLTKLVQRGKAPEIVVHVLEDLRKRTALVPLKDFANKEAETSGLREQLAVLFTEWVRMYHHPASNEKAHIAHVTQLQQQGILQGEDISSLFFRVCTELSVESYIKHKATPGAPQAMSFQAADAFARLIVLLVKNYNDPAAANINIAKINLYTKILSIIVLVLVHSHEQRRQHFNQRPFFRLFSSLLNDLHTFEQHLQPIYFQTLSAISNTFHTLQPSFLPGFTFSWLQLVSHRYFMPKLLLAENQKGWPFFQRLMVDLFRFMAPFLKRPDLTEGIRLLYKGTLRVLLVLLHDFPEFLCSYHFSFMDVIPHTCIQLRNLILSAFPGGMRLPDPFTPNLKVDLLPEINQSPQILSDYTSSLLANNMKQDIDAYLKNRAPGTFLADLKNRLTLPSTAGEGEPVKYNIPAINSLVLYVGIQAIAQAQQGKMQGASPITHSAPMDIFQQLVQDLDTEGRYLLLSAIANHLRYPNSHTHYFSCVLLYLFAEAQQEIIQEQITRVLLERLIVNRPHPYGLLITFIELIRNPRYNFWDHTNFIRCAPEIERLFSSVAKSINSSFS
ncbi:hypothetical protein HK102_011503 [Quaeritorhiza haematococci]|nr:hypothetical protein HK102_011503 [Quaeritorhiza haematococci]